MKTWQEKTYSTQSISKPWAINRLLLFFIVHYSRASVLMCALIQPWKWIKKKQNIVNPFAAQESNAKFENFPSMNQLLYGRRFLLVLLIVYTSMKLTTSRDSDLFDGVQFSPQKHDEKKVNKWFKYTTTYNTNWSLIMSTKFFA